ncbi:MAG: protein kinase, partial [Rhodothermales bacterium]|nr:protein kinase [Rhodothermales bacterium]
SGVAGGLSESRPFIAMEYIDGETLSERIEKGPLPLKDAISYAAQIAEGLKTAHEAGVVHRDIKSGNIMLTSKGVVKVLDFGLAKTAASTKLTQMGSTLGTVAYMSPEQAKGEDVDRRSDVWSLGVILYEMITGRLPFKGDYEQAVVYGILNEDPESMTTLRAGVPMALDGIIAKMLAKDPDMRYQHVDELPADLKAIDLGSSIQTSRISTSRAKVDVTEDSVAQIPSGAPTPAQAEDSNRPAWILPLVGIAALVVGALGAWLLKTPDAESSPIRRLDVTIERMIAQDPAISPDGRYWAFETADTVGFTGITIIDLHDGTYYSPPQSEGYSTPRFSPDSRWLLAGNGTEIVSILVPDGRPVPLGETGADFTWIDENTVAITRNGQEIIIHELESRESREIDLARFDTTISRLDFPGHIPGTDQILITADIRGGDANVVSYDLADDSYTVLARNACCARPIRDDVVVYHIGNRLGQVVAQKYDASDKVLAGSPADVIGSQMLTRSWAVGHDDSFLHQVEGGFEEEEVFSLLDARARQSRDMRMELANYDRVSWSPDGQKLAVERHIGVSGQSIYIAVFDPDTGVEQRLTYQFEISRAPTWSPNGKIYYSAGPAQDSDIYAKNADGTGGEELVVEDGDYAHASRDGKWLAFASGPILKALNLETGEITLIDSTFARQGDPKISPDSRFIAFTADNQTSNFTSGGQRLFVRSFPDPSGFYEKVTETYADDPIWAADGSALFFRNRGRVYQMPVDISSVFSKRGSPTLIHTYPGVNVRLDMNYVTGEMVVVHPQSNLDFGRSTRFIFIESFSAYLDKLFER